MARVRKVDGRSANGGAREGAGRQAEDGATKLTRHTVLLDPATVRLARKAGGGTLSVGIRTLVKAASVS